MPGLGKNRNETETFGFWWIMKYRAGLNPRVMTLSQIFAVWPSILLKGYKLVNLLIEENFSLESTPLSCENNSIELRKEAWL